MIERNTEFNIRLRKVDYTKGEREHCRAQFAEFIYYVTQVKFVSHFRLFIYLISHLPNHKYQS